MQKLSSSYRFANRGVRSAVCSTLLAFGSLLAAPHAVACPQIYTTYYNINFLSQMITPGNGSTYSAPYGGKATIPLKGSARLVTNFDHLMSPECVISGLRAEAKFLVDGSTSSATGEWRDGVVNGSVQLRPGRYSIGIRGAVNPGGFGYQYVYSDTVTVNVTEETPPPVRPRNPGGPVGPVTGWVDGIFNGGNTFSGWACDKNVARSIDVHFYLDGPAGSGIGPLVVTANVAREEGVAVACSTVGVAHGWSVDLTPYRAQYPGRRIFVHGISASGGPNLEIGQSGAFAIPGL